MAGGISRLVTRGRAIPWLALYQSGKWIYGHGRRAWQNLEPGERERLGGLVRKSKGRRSNLSSKERDELRMLVKKAAIGEG
ncbi:MAG: hypothetical protein AUG48_07785 [Actinobacteria bacterium 13_1_20CM_3_68_9]|nr:MAG: hypothetical protein AUG48_07785 [Actinobacteria bacterium 13_1_20CM_3_68_9]